MKFFLTIFIIVLFAASLFSQQEDYSYEVIINGSESGKSGYYSPRKIYRIKQPKIGGFVNGSVYLKMSHYIEPPALQKLILEKLSFETKVLIISRPFVKYLPNNSLLSRTELDLIYHIEFDFDNSLRLAKEINSIPEVTYCVPEAYYEFCELPNDPLYNDQWGLEIIGLASAWDKAKAGRNIIIGVVDSGIDTDHNDLKSQMFVNTKEIPGNGIDDDDNGFVDDVSGWDFVGNITAVEASNRQWKPNNNPKPAFDNNDHGTHVAGIAAATTNNGIGMSSVSWNATILPIKCAMDNLSAQTGSRNVYRPYDGMMYAAMMGADVINCSWSSDYNDPLMNEVIEYVLSKDIAIVAAAGNFIINNDEIPFYPASLPGIFAVGSINKAGSPSGFTHYGVSVDIFAPGESIVSTMPKNIYNTKTGSSMAAPFVTGVVALLKSAKPGISSEEIRQRIRSSAKLYGKSMHLQERFFFGALDAGAALNNNFSGGKSTPGISVESVYIEGKDAITTSNPTMIKFNFRNYLSDAENINVKIYPKGNYIIPDTTNFIIQQFTGQSSHERDLSFRMSNLNPWFRGVIDFVIEYSDDKGYYNIEIIKIPVDLPTTNTYFVAETSPEYDAIVWNSASSAGRFDFWVGGYNYDMGGGMIYHWGRTLGFFPQDTVNSVKALSVARGFGAVSGRNLKSYIKSTRDSGRTWQSEDITNFVIKVHDIIVFENEDIIAFGEKIKQNQSFGIAKREAGKWSAIENNFSLKSNETLIRGSVASFGDKVMAGTSAGRVIYSDDKGKSWSISELTPEGIIRFIVLINQDSAVAVAPGSGTAKNVGKVYNTINGGQTWTSGVFDFRTIGRVPVYAYCPDSSNSVIVLHSNGEVTASEDLGFSWRHELTQFYRFGKVNTGAGYTFGGKSRLWNQAYDIGFLEFDIIPSNARYSLSIAGNSEIDFDTSAIGSVKYANIFLINDGNMRLDKIMQRFILNEGTDDDEIILTEDFNHSFAPDKLESAEIKFSPKSTGKKSASLTVTTKAGDNQFKISGTAYDPASVSELLDEQIKIAFEDNHIRIVNWGQLQSPLIAIYDINGHLIESGKVVATQNEPCYRINPDLYNSGVYLVVIIEGKQKYSRKVIFIK